MACIVKEDKRLVTFLMVCSNLVSHILKDFAEVLEVNIVHLDDICVLSPEAFDSLPNIFSIINDLR